ncbi:MAG TPA: SpoIIE family protein phosphatase [Mycobacteriales bacterium]|nr:SpoIIE family protein phosphatase [Mycobacteriales bacterium]
MTTPDAAPRERRSRGLVAYVAVLAVGAALAGVAAARYDTDPPGRVHWVALPVLALLVALAEVLVVRVRYGDEVEGLNLVEAALAPMLFAFPAGPVVVAVGVAHLVTSIVRRLAPLKTAFNVAQWALAAAAGAAVVERVAAGTGVTATTATAVVAALVAVWVVNHAAFTLVVAFAEGKRPDRLLRELVPVILPGWVGGWFVNAMLGLLYVLAYAAHPAAVLLFPVPLVLLHLAYRGYATARADRLRLAVLHSAAQALAERIDPREAVPEFLGEVARGFEARAVLLVLTDGGARAVHACRRGAYEVAAEPLDHVSLAGALTAHPGPVRVTAGDRSALARAVAAEGWRDCLAAPLVDEGRTVGALVVLDQAGVTSGTELAVLETVARETAGALAKGRLVADVMEERARLDELVTTTSDGICAIGADGVVRSWNPALERITGLAAADVVGRNGALARLHARTADGTPVELAGWRDQPALPADLRVTDRAGEAHRLSCSYSRRGDDSVLVVVARDVTAVDEIEQLRAEFGRLVEAEAAQRLVVEQLQAAVMPPHPEVGGAELGVSYLASDANAPTGGDLYDWQVLPDGDVHVAVVDVLGHGVAATKDALAVVHTLRTIAVDGTPLEDMVARADKLLGAQHPDLVATVVVVRFDPRTGRVRVASGGHPPALVVSARGEVSQLSAAGGAIGWPGAGSDLIAEATLDVRDALVLYTDGLVEAGKDILAGMDALVGHARAVAHLPAPELTEELLRRSLEGAARLDDTLALVLRRVPVPAAERTRSWPLDADPAAVGRARRAFSIWLAEHDAVSEDALLAASELLANAVRAARGRVTLTATLTDDGIVVEVADDGSGVVGLEERGRDLPDADSPSGRGLFIVRSVADEVTAMSTAEGSVVRAVVPYASRDRSRA